MPVSYATITDQITIAAPAQAVWAALVDRDKSRIWAGVDFATDWQPGSRLLLTPLIVTKKGADKGEVLRACHVEMETPVPERLRSKAE